MVMELDVGGNSGAVYIPLASIVPILGFPPAIPLIDQITAGFDPSPVFAVNCCCVTPGMDALGGVTVNAVSPGPPGRIAWAQPPSNTTNAVSITSAERFTVFPLLLLRLLAAHTHDVSYFGRFKMRRDWFWENTGVDRLALLDARPDSEQLVRYTSKVRIPLLVAPASSRRVLRIPTTIEKKQARRRRYQNRAGGSRVMASFTSANVVVSNAG
jgi:hypothetical protein